MTLEQPISTARILLICGTGGVGKTTIAAVLGLAAARRGRRTLVLTIDPARRLANALGLSEMSEEYVRVWPPKPSSVVRCPSSAAPPTSSTTEDGIRNTDDGFLDCTMLDAKQTFDTIIERYSPDARAAQIILGNPLYQQLSTVIAGSSEYMAMEKLYEITTTHDYDLIILDTPPTQHALDFFQAPERMIRALTDSMLRLFLKPSMAAGKFGARFLSKGADTVIKLFGKVTGAEFLKEISDLLMSTVGLFGGFQDRAAAVQSMLRAQSTGVILVTVPQVDLMSDAIHFTRQAHREKMQIMGAICNRMLAPMPSTEPIPQDVPDYLVENWKHYNARCTRATREHDRLRAALPNRIPLVTLPQQMTDMHTLESLGRMAEEIV